MSEHPEPVDLFRWLDEAYRSGTLAAVRKMYPGLSAEDVDDVWGETQVALLLRWPADTQVSKEEKFGGLLRTIALRKACDLLRRRTSQIERIASKGREEGGTLVGDHVGECKGRYWSTSAEQQELKMLVGEAFGMLSPAEWLVVSAYCENYPHLKTARKLLEFVLEEFPEMRSRKWTTVDIRQLLNHGRAEVRKYLRKKGYDIGIQE